MATYGGPGIRPVARGQIYLAWLVVALVVVFAFQFFAYEQRWASQRTPAMESNQDFEAMLDEYLLSPKNDTTGNDHRELRQLVENLCKMASRDVSGSQMSQKDCLARFWAARPAFQRRSSSMERSSTRTAEICDSGVNEKKVRALEHEVASLHDIMRNATIPRLMSLKDDTRAEHNSFMSSLNPADISGLPGEFEFPSDSSLGRILCLTGNDTGNGTLNKYGFAWKEHLPPNTTLVPGITLISSSDWSYGNIWHGMSSLAPFTTWREKSGCAVADRLLLYHKGEVVPWMSSWVGNLMHAVFGREIPVQVQAQHTGRPEKENSLTCFERAVVNRKGLSSTSMNGMFETMRCRTKAYCKVGIAASDLNGDGNSSNSKTAAAPVQVTLYLREGARAFKNSSGVQHVVQRACQEHGDCNLEIAYANNLTFCEQVTLMSKTDVLITTHGAQLTNMLFMPKYSSVMEFQGYQWLELAGVGQYIYTWLASWAEVNHEGIWRQTEGPPCPHPAEDKLACFFFYKDFKISHNETHLADWTTEVLKKFSGTTPPSRSRTNGNCTCDSADRARNLAPWLT